jgi:hypothetical protein
MKCNHFGNVSFAMFILLATTGALAQSRMEANVPFAFHVGSTVLPAGRYQIVEDHITESVKLRNLETRAIAIVGVQQDSPRDDARYKMIFHEFGSEHFLSAVHGGRETLDIELPVTRLEKQYRSMLVVGTPRNGQTQVEVALK